MTTFAGSTPYAQSSTANIRAYGAELNGWMKAVGLTQTTDTGQTDWTTVVIPGANTIYGIELWQFVDGSLTFKWEWGTAGGNNTGSPQVYLTVGTGSDGAGNITGILFPRSQITVPNNSTIVGGARPTYICHTADFFGMVYKINSSASGTSICAFAIEKMVDSTGAASGVGIVITYQNSSVLLSCPGKRAIRFDGTYDSGVSTSFCAVPGNITTSSVGADRQVFLHAHVSPRVIFSNFMCSVISSELVLATTFNATLVGTTPRTYISITNGMGLGNNASLTATWGLAMLWE